MVVPKAEIGEIMKGGRGAADVDEPVSVGDVVWVRESLRSMPACRAVVVDAWAGGHSVLLERVDERFDLPSRVSPEPPRLALTRVQRSKLFDGDLPHIGGEGLPPVTAGETVQLSSKVRLTVLRVDVKNGRWRLHYELKDTRDPVRLLRRTPPAHRGGNELDIGDKDAIAHAADQSFYTSTPGAAVSDAGEAPDRRWVDVRHAAIREFDHQQRLAKFAQKQRERSKARRKRAA